MNDTFPRGPEELWDAFPKAQRDEMERMIRRFVWHFATATAVGMSKDGRTMPPMPRELGATITEATFVVAMNALHAEAIKETK